MTGKRPCVVVVGAGGMGALFGSILQEGGLPVTMIDTNAEHVAAMRERGLRISGFGGERTVPVKAVEDASGIGHADIILFQCKSHGTRAGAEGIRHLVRNGTACVSFQNGLGNEEIIGEAVGPENVLGGLTAMAAVMEGPGHIRDFSRVPSHIGEMGGGTSKRAQIIARALTEAGLETRVSDDVTRDIWKKLLGNIAMSAASGATDMTSVEVLSVPELNATAFRALDEALAVAAAVGIELDRDAAVRGLVESALNLCAHMASMPVPTGTAPAPIGWPNSPICPLRVSVTSPRLSCDCTAIQWSFSETFPALFEIDWNNWRLPGTNHHEASGRMLRTALHVILPRSNAAGVWNTRFRFS